VNARPSGALLSVRGLTKRFGGLVAVDALDFDLAPGEILGLIGPNGAGKTTTFNMIAGAYAPTNGEIRFAGEAIHGLPPHEIARRGIMRTFQHNMPFASMSIADNVLVGAHTKFRGGLGGIVTGAARRDEAEIRRRAVEMIAFVGLGDAIDVPVTALSFGQGRLLEVARALAGEPKVILFDEPAAGLTPSECERLAGIIRGIAAGGIAVLLIEHDMRFLLPLAQRVVVLNFGRMIADGTPEAIRDDPAVIAAYLGKPAVMVVEAQR
jgi:ABC-type branched-subunit amino acid transport system ATPase component